MGNLSKEEQKALAMHELMKREQEKSYNRIKEQRRINALTTEELEAIVYDKPAPPTNNSQGEEG